MEWLNRKSKSRLLYGIIQGDRQSFETRYVDIVCNGRAAEPNPEPELTFVEPEGRRPDQRSTKAKDSRAFYCRHHLPSLRGGHQVSFGPKHPHESGSLPLILLPLQGQLLQASEPITEILAVFADVATYDLGFDPIQIIPVSLLPEHLQLRRAPEFGDLSILQHAQEVGPDGSADMAVMSDHSTYPTNSCL